MGRQFETHGKERGQTRLGTGSILGNMRRLQVVPDIIKMALVPRVITMVRPEKHRVACALRRQYEEPGLVVSLVQRHQFLGGVVPLFAGVQKDADVVGVDGPPHDFLEVCEARRARGPFLSRRCRGSGGLELEHVAERRHGDTRRWGAVCNPSSLIPLWCQDKLIIRLWLRL